MIAAMWYNTRRARAIPALHRHRSGERDVRGLQGSRVRRLNIMDGDEINTRNFDALVEMIASAEGDVIIDNGASSFVAAVALPHQQPGAGIAPRRRATS